MADSRMFGRSEVSIQAIPYVPAQVDLADLSASGSLLSDEQQSALLAIKGELEERRYTKDEINALLADKKIKLPYGVINHEGELYVVYLGAKHEKHLGKGEHGKAKLAQRISDKQFFVLKLTSQLEEAIAEFKVLKDTGQTPQTKPIADRAVVRTAKSGKPEAQSQALMLMNLATGKDMYHFIDQELGYAYDDETTGAQIIPNMMSPALRLQLVLDTVNKVNDLHLTKHYLHRDLQPGNILLDMVAQQARLVDFGQAIAIAPLNRLTRSASGRELKGSTANYSPELRRQIPLFRSLSSRSIQAAQEEFPEVTYNEATEMYAVGITIAKFLHLLNPVPDELEHKPEEWGNYVMTGDEAQQLIIEDDSAKGTLISTIHALPEDIALRMIDLIHKMTEHDPKKRIKFRDAMVELEQMLKELNEKHAIQVGILDLADGCDAEALQAKLNDAFQQGVTEIIFINSGKTAITDNELLQAQRYCEQQGYYVGDQCFNGRNPDKLEDAVQQHLASRPVRSQVTKLVPVARPVSEGEPDEGSSTPADEGSVTPPTVGMLLK